MKTIREPARKTPVIHECDVCVIGGSCTGVFAAVRAAQMGATVSLIENNGFFGGVATAGLVNVWHSRFDGRNEKQIIAGLTSEMIDRLVKRDAAVVLGLGEKVRKSDRPELYMERGARINTYELMIELDILVKEHKNIRPFLHTRFVDALQRHGKMTHAVIEDKSGRRAVKASCFIDATGDGDVITRMDLPFTKKDDLQPPTTCAVIHGLNEVEKANPDFTLEDVPFDPKYPNALQKGFLWKMRAIGSPGGKMVAGTRVNHADCSDAESLTFAEMEGRRQVRAICDIVRDNFKKGKKISLGALSTYIGIRETRHATCLHRFTQDELLSGARFEDAIANGSYPVDVHHSGKEGITFRYLEGSQLWARPKRYAKRDRLKKKAKTYPTYYQIPYRSLVPKKSKNVLVAGRIVDADRGAYGAIRVMINCNQTGEAAGIASVLSLDTKTGVKTVNVNMLRRKLADFGAIVL